MSGLQQVVAKFLAERDQVIIAINNCPASNMEDYWRWQGNAEARRVLSQDLERDGIDLTVDAAVGNRERVAQTLLAAFSGGKGDVYDLADHLIEEGLCRDEATVKAEAIREVAQAQRQLASRSRTNNGQAEHEDFADWLDDRAFAIAPDAVEGAHP